ncbi:isoleucine--tRNA ligase [bacterium]|nr:isoleucine--tRNA ligase [bacterium]
MEYKDTLNLPQTDFPMKANLSQKEPEVLARWGDNNLYEAVMKKNKGKPQYVFHDGPPYANGGIHLGHVLNKILKDIVVRSKNMSGYHCDFVPGWDCHGLPIELQVDKSLGGKKNEMSIVDIRRACRSHAEKYVNIQRDEFKRLGCMARWDKPYLTMNYEYEACVARQLGKIVEKGGLYKGRKPVYWCAHCTTALAEAEVEYENHTSPSVYVKFHLEDDADLRKDLKLKKEPIYVVIWTTTPWTIPANLAITLHPKFEYVAVKVNDEIWVIAEGMLQKFMNAVEIKDYDVVGKIDPKTLEHKKCKHPMIDRDSIIILGEHVTLEAGTGCVHTAPGHGQEDYEIGLKYGLEILTPVDQRGRFTEDCSIDWLVGKFVEAANQPIVDNLKEIGALIKSEKVEHSYPHCWRCKKPIVFRSTEQWFISVEKNDLRKKALEAIDNVTWVPSWGRNRIYGMLENRPDWCISRQRLWGVPIVSVVCGECGSSSTNPEMIENAAKIFEKESADAWYVRDVKDFLPKGYKCPECGSDKGFVKEKDILDVWFDSGISYKAVIEEGEKQPVPVDLYLEGSDQHRGWFHTSLLTSIAINDQAPYKTVLTHGFTVDENGKKYSKSAKNYVPLENILKEYGAEILRLWVSAEDYRNDVRFSKEIVARLVEAYRKIRNTCRYMLGNLNDFNPDKDMVDFEKLPELDKWALHELQLLIKKITTAYDEFNFHVIFHALNKFCTVDMSAFYLDILKDRLYCESKDGHPRRSAQTVLYNILSALVHLMSPIFIFTSDEIWKYMPKTKGMADFVHLSEMPKVNEDYMDDKAYERWEKFEGVRSDVTKVLETARKEKVIGNSLNANVVLQTEGDLEEFLKSFGDSLADLFIVSGVEFGKAEGDFVGSSENYTGFKVAVKTAVGTKCVRCWKVLPSVGTHKDHPEICDRCYNIVV